MPALSPTMSTGSIVRWHVEEGATVGPGDQLCEVETDKVTVEIRAPDAGVIQELCAQEGETILVGADLVKYLKAAPLRSLDSPSPRSATP